MQNFREEIRRLTGKRRVDLVFEHIGADVWEDSIMSLTRFGRLVTCGASSDYHVSMNVAHIWHKQLTIIGSNHGTMNELTTILKLLEAKKGRFAAEVFPNPGKVDVSLRRTCYSRAQADEALARISSWADYAVTPLRALPGAAAELGLGALCCKDESRRLNLASFKALGAVYASVSEVSALLEKRLGHAISDRDLLDGKYREALAGNFLICCTDGNHGFSVARAARRMGCRAVIYIPSGVSAGREAALQRECAEVVRIDGIYDEAYAAVERSRMPIMERCSSRTPPRLTTKTFPSAA